MSDDETAAAPVEKPVFTDKEEAVLKAAWRCLKSPPEIDIEKLMHECGFNTMKTASNTWGVIKKKLNVGVAAVKNASAADPASPKAPATPKKTGAPRKRIKKIAAQDDGDDDDEGEARSLKKPRQSPAKKPVKEEANDEELGDEA